jgi:hypothetical protein
MLKRSLQLWQTLNQKYKDKHSDNYLLKMTGGLMIGLPNSEVILGANHIYKYNYQIHMYV